MDMLTGLGVFTKGVHYMPGMVMKMGFLWKLGMLLVGVFWVVMLVNCLQRKFEIPMDKIAWVLVLVFLPVLGAFIYLFSLYFKPKKNKKK
tara:strand:+ start:54 stop:323 length:270 start_codon:yes stop_codon:yes gene_type:complete